MFPVRCYTCNSLIGDKYTSYTSRVSNEEKKGNVLDSLEVKRICCRRMFLTHVHVISNLLRFSNDDVILDDSGTALFRSVNFERTVSCD